MKSTGTFWEWNGLNPTFLRMLQVLHMYSSFWIDPVIGGRMIKKQTRTVDHRWYKGTRPTILKPGFGSGLDQYSREIMHVRQSNGSKVSSFDVITGHLVRFLVTIYTEHGEVSHLISCYCWDEHRQWSHSSVWKTTSLDVLLNMQVMMSYNKHVWHVCSWIVDLWWCMFLNEFVTFSPGQS